MKLLIFLPLLVPFASALLLMGGRSRPGWQKGVSLVSAVLQIAVAVNLIAAVQSQDILTAHMGNWLPPFGIAFAVDRLGAIMVALTAVVGFTSVVFAFHDIDAERSKGYFFALFQFLLFGINGAFMTGDLFNLFVFFEVVLMTSYVLLVLGNTHFQAKSGFTYLTLNLIGSTLFLTAAGILFGQLGTLNMADIARRIDTVPNQGLVTAVAILFFCVFGLKSAMFPINNWLPDSYTAPPTPVSAVFAGLLTKVGVYSMYRVFGTIFTHDLLFTHKTILLPLAGFTMILGVWGAMIQYDIPSILAYHSISQVGYMLMGLALYSPLALAGGIFHIVHHSLIKSSLFLIGGGVEGTAGSQNLKKIGGLGLKVPLIAIFFMISAMALAGVPPLSGFYSKFALVTDGLHSHHPVLVVSALATSLFTLYSMIKIWRLGFWGDHKAEQELAAHPAKRKAILISTGLSVTAVVFVSLFAGPVMRFCRDAGIQLMNREAYIQKVLMK